MSCVLRTIEKNQQGVAVVKPRRWKILEIWNSELILSIF